MIDILASRPLAKAVIARRETQRHLDCLTRQIAARAGRQAITVKVRSRARRRSGPRFYHQELADRLVFERWGELDTLACRLAVQEQIIDALEQSGDAAVLPRTGSAALTPSEVRGALSPPCGPEGCRAWPCRLPAAGI